MRHWAAPVLGQRDQEGEDGDAEGGSMGGSGSMRERREKETEGWKWVGKDMGGKKGRSREEGWERGRRQAGLGV